MTTMLLEYLEDQIKYLLKNKIYYKKWTFLGWTIMLRVTENIFIFNVFFFFLNSAYHSWDTITPVRL